MAEEKIIVINVVTNTDDLKKLVPALKKVENQAKQTGKSTKDSFTEGGITFNEKYRFAVYSCFLDHAMHDCLIIRSFI